MCPFCGRHCRVPISATMPLVVVRAFQIAKVETMATCEKGAADEYARYGASYADVIAERLTRGKNNSAAEMIREQARELRARARETMDAAVVAVSRSDQRAGGTGDRTKSATGGSPTSGECGDGRR